MSKHRARQAIAVVGIDLGKTWTQVCGQDASGRVQSGPEDEAEGLASVPVQCAALSDWDGGVWAVASLGADVTGVWTRGAPDRTAVCEAVREGEQDGPCGCRGDLRGGAASVDAVCGGPECGTAGPAGSAPDPQSGGHTAYGLGQSAPWLAGGIRGGDHPGPLTGAPGLAGDPGRRGERLEPAVSGESGRVVRGTGAYG